MAAGKDRTMDHMNEARGGRERERRKTKCCQKGNDSKNTRDKNRDEKHKENWGKGHLQRAETVGWRKTEH